MFDTLTLFTSPLSDLLSASHDARWYSGPFLSVISFCIAASLDGGIYTPTLFLSVPVVVVPAAAPEGLVEAVGGGGADDDDDEGGGAVGTGGGSVGVCTCFVGSGCLDEDACADSVMSLWCDLWWLRRDLSRLLLLLLLRLWLWLRLLL